MGMRKGTEVLRGLCTPLCVVLMPQSPNNKRLRCVIEHESTVFPIWVAPDDKADDLKTIIQNTRKYGSLNGVDASDLELWKVNARLISVPVYLLPFLRSRTPSPLPLHQTTLYPITFRLLEVSLSMLTN
jgi:hypothetical protein